MRVKPAAADHLGSKGEGSLHCPICESVEFGPGPGGRLSRTKLMPQCSRCGSVEWQRVARVLLQALLPSAESSERRALTFSGAASYDKRWCASIAGFDAVAAFAEKDAVLPYADESFDLVISLHVLHRTLDFRSLLSQSIRVLSPDGFLLLSYPSPATRKTTDGWDKPNPARNNMHRIFGMDFEPELAALLSPAKLLALHRADPITGDVEIVYLASKSPTRINLARGVLGPSSREMRLVEFPPLAGPAVHKPAAAGTKPPRAQSKPGHAIQAARRGASIVAPAVHTPAPPEPTPTSSSGPGVTGNHVPSPLAALSALIEANSRSSRGAADQTPFKRPLIWKAFHSRDVAASLGLEGRSAEEIFWFWWSEGRQAGPVSANGGQVFLRRTGGELFFAEMDPPQQPHLRLESPQVHFADRMLSVRAALSCDDPEYLREGAVQLSSAGLVLATSNLLLDAGKFALEMDVACSWATARAPLVVHLLGTDVYFALPSLSRAPDPLPATIPPLLAVGIRAEGSFDGLRIGRNGAVLLHGWARDPAHPDAALALDVFLEGKLLTSGYAATMRRDVAAKNGGSKVCGFLIEIPANIVHGESVSVTVRARAPVGSLAHETRQIRFPPYGDALEAGATWIEAKPIQVERRAGRSCAAVVLTQDGAEVLSALLESIQQFEPQFFGRIVVIDHQSEDHTAAVITRFSASLPLEHHIRPRSASFAESNNHAAALCTEELIFFINNDVVLTGPIFAEMSDHLSSGVGVVGCRLMDPRLPGSDLGPQAPQHVGIHFAPLTQGVIRPFESSMLTDMPFADNSAILVPAVTGALFAMERSSFVTLGGFDEAFFYGWEDVDLCMRADAAGLTNICVNHVAATHIRAYSRRQMPQAVAARRARNPDIFNRRWAYLLRSRIRKEQIASPGFWLGRRLHLGFVVSEAGSELTADDSIIAMNLARAINKALPSRCFFFSKSGPVDASGIDLLIVMTDDFDVREVTNLAATSSLVAWARDWFHRWAVRPWRERFHLWLASSDRARGYLSTELGRAVGLLRIGASVDAPEGGTRDEALVSDIVFTGVGSGSARDAAAWIETAGKYRIRAFGAGWDAHPRTGHLAGGALPPGRLPGAYAGTKLVVHEADAMTATWGGLDRGLWDALAAGAPVLTNSGLGVAEALPGLVPSYSDADELRGAIDRFMSNPELRRETAMAARAEVLQHHTYASRSTEMLAAISQRLATGFRISIKISCPSVEVSDGCEDWNFALLLRRELEELGHSVRIDCVADWYGPHANADDVCLAIRGRERYEPQASQMNLVWIVRHPEHVSVAELLGYDHCFAASRQVCDHFSPASPTALEYLPLCTDGRVFFPVSREEDGAAPAMGPVFVGPFRDVVHPILEGAIAEGLAIGVYGDGWENLIPPNYVKARSVPHDELGALYRRASLVLSAEGDDMRRWGIIPCGIFDAVACGRHVVVGDAVGLTEFFGPVIHVWRPGCVLGDILSSVQDGAGANAEIQKASAQVLAEHSFKARAAKLDSVMRAAHLRRQSDTSRSSFASANGMS
jgi:O-antigen biosynthesis protein